MELPKGQKEKLLVIPLIAALAGCGCPGKSPAITETQHGTAQAVRKAADPENIFVTMWRLLDEPVYLEKEEEDKYHTIGGRLSPHYAFAYPERFTAYGITCLVLAGISPEEAEEWPEALRGEDIAVLKNRYRVSLEAAKQYRGSRFSGSEIIELLISKVPIETANAYSKRFTGSDIDLLAKGYFMHSPRIPPVPPEQANKFSKRFNAYEIGLLATQSIGPEFAEQYPERFNAGDILILITCGVDPQKAASYPENLHIIDICEQLGFKRECVGALDTCGCMATEALKDGKKSYEYRDGRIVPYQPDEIDLLILREETENKK
ncbi:hypothetical protein HYW83_05860 [Candidatus Peregrinibacteria bacterium]|nr:hypothetical protein [Candidatus Peregrinibacteria bacterium]